MLVNWTSELDSFTPAPLVDGLATNPSSDRPIRERAGVRPSATRILTQVFWGQRNTMGLDPGEREYARGKVA